MQVVNKESLSYDIYHREAIRFEPMTPEQEVAAFIRLRNGDESVREEIIQSNQRFIIWVASSSRVMHQPLEDRIQTANLGLLKAIDHFDETRGVRLVSYATLWIRREFQVTSLTTDHHIRLPVMKMSNLYRAIRWRADFEKRTGRVPTAAEMSAETDIPSGAIESSALLKSVSFDEPTENGQRPLHDHIDLAHPPIALDLLEKRQIADLVTDILKMLPDHLAETLRLLYFSGDVLPSLSKTARKLGITKQAVWERRHTAFAIIHRRAQIRDNQKVYKAAKDSLQVAGY